MEACGAGSERASPAARLPLEMLCHVLRYAGNAGRAFPETPYFCYPPPRLLALRLVSRRWAQAVRLLIDPNFEEPLAVRLAEWRVDDTFNDDAAVGRALALPPAWSGADAAAFFASGCSLVRRMHIRLYVDARAFQSVSDVKTCLGGSSRVTGVLADHAGDVKKVFNVFPFSGSLGFTDSCSAHAALSLLRYITSPLPAMSTAPPAPAVSLSRRRCADVDSVWDATACSDYELQQLQDGASTGGLGRTPHPLLLACTATRCTLARALVAKLATLDGALLERYLEQRGYDFFAPAFHKGCGPNLEECMRVFCEVGYGHAVLGMPGRVTAAQIVALGRQLYDFKLTHWLSLHCTDAFVEALGRCAQGVAHAIELHAYEVALRLLDAEDAAKAGAGAGAATSRHARYLAMLAAYRYDLYADYTPDQGPAIDYERRARPLIERLCSRDALACRVKASDVLFALLEGAPKFTGTPLRHACTAMPGGSRHGMTDTWRKACTRDTALTPLEAAVSFFAYAPRLGIARDLLALAAARGDDVAAQRLVAALAMGPPGGHERHQSGGSGYYVLNVRELVYADTAPPLSTRYTFGCVMACGTCSECTRAPETALAIAVRCKAEGWRTALFEPL